MKSRFLGEKYVHLAFEVSLVLKAAFAVAETLAGIGVYFVTQQLLFGLVERITREDSSKIRVTSSPTTFFSQRSISP